MINNISVIGAGTMGHGIAISFALHGYSVNIFDKNQDIIENVKAQIKIELEKMASEGLIADDEIQNIIGNISTRGDLKECVCEADYVIETIPEILSLKQDLFITLDKYCRKETIFASNTSGLKLEDIMSGLSAERQRKCLICHWFNPPYLVPAVELSHFGNMPEEIFQEVRELYLKIGKKPVTVLKDINGLIANRLQHGLLREMLALIKENVASVEDIEAAAKYGPLFRLATTGILEICDMGGIDIWAETAKNIWPDLDNSNVSSQVLDKMLEEGNLGIKSGRGFYGYDQGDREDKLDKFLTNMMKQLKLQQETE